MRLIEVIEGEDTSPETVRPAANFAQAIKKMPVRCHECPGFVVNRILVSTASEIWRYQDETGIDVEELDSLITEKAQMPMGPFRVADMSGLDTVVKVARDMQEAYGDRFYVHRGMEELVERGDLGAKSEGASMSTPEATQQIDEQVADRFQLKALVEACLVLEEGVAGVRDVDLGMMMGTGMVPGPFARADFRGLDDVLARQVEQRGARLRAAARPAPAGRPGPPRRQERPGLLPLPAAGRRLGERAGQARHARRRRDPLARQPARQLARPERGRGARAGLEGDRGRRPRR